MKVIWNGMDIVILAVGGLMLLVIGIALVVLMIKEWWREKHERTDKA